MGSNPMTRTIGLTLPVKAHHYERIESNVLNAILLMLFIGVLKDLILMRKH